MHYKTYTTYNDYVKHQSEKLDISVKKTKDWNEAIKPVITREKENFRKEFAPLSLLLTSGNAILCLGARLGMEVAVFRELGFPGLIGIDINPDKSIEHGLVVYGDFHDLKYDTGTFANVYTNTIDHCLNLDKVLEEATRVLAPGGKLIVRCGKENKTGGAFESCYWENLEEVITIATKHNLTLIYNKSCTAWDGNQASLVFTSKE